MEGGNNGKRIARKRGYPSQDRATQRNEQAADVGGLAGLVFIASVTTLGQGKKTDSVAPAQKRSGSWMTEMDKAVQ
jgi:hypothetical protein